MLTVMAVTILPMGNRGENSEYCEEKSGKEKEKEENLCLSLILPALSGGNSCLSG